MVKNIGSYIRIFCMEHKEPVPFVAVKNHPQYVCARYYKKDDEHPDGYEDVRCENLLRYDDYIKIIEKISAIVESDSADKTEAHYKGMKFTYKNMELTVIKHTDKHIDLGVRYLKRSFL